MTSNSNIPVALVLELSAPCGEHCEGCRYSEHGIGNPDAVRDALARVLDSQGPSVKEIHLVANGEPGRSKDFKRIVSEAVKRGFPLSIACVNEISVEPEGFIRVEVSATRTTIERSRKAIQKALNFNIPTTITLIDDGSEDMDKRVEELHEEFPGLAGFFIRALQPEGLSQKRYGTTRSGLFRPEIPMGIFPMDAYYEARDFSGNHKTIRINCWGQEVPFLGGYVEAK